MLIDELKYNKISFTLSEPMKNHTSFHIGGPADVFVTPDTIDKCIKTISLCKGFDFEYFVLGKGTNLLVNDEGVHSVVICVSNLLSDIELVDDNTIKCGAGSLLSNVCSFAQKNSLSGMEFAYGIPGTCGGAVVMNAGAYGGEIKDIFTECEYIDENGTLCKLDLKDSDFGYRHSFFSDKNYCIVSVTFKLKKGNAEEIKAQMTDILNRRKEKQPLEFPSAGSTFKRPQGSYASMLIDNCGLKGLNVGDAQVSEKHAGFIINRENATCNDVLKLIQKVSDTVFEKTGYKLEPEVKII